jgi:hypothetical protein
MIVVSMASLWADLYTLDVIERQETTDLSRGGGGSGRRGGGRRLEEGQGHDGGDGREQRR